MQVFRHEVALAHAKLPGHGTVLWVPATHWPAALHVEDEVTCPFKQVLVEQGAPVVTRCSHAPNVGLQTEVLHSGKPGLVGSQAAPTVGAGQIPLVQKDDVYGTFPTHVGVTHWVELSLFVATQFLFVLHVQTLQKLPSSQTAAFGQHVGLLPVLVQQ